MRVIKHKQTFTYCNKSYFADYSCLNLLTLDLALLFVQFKGIKETSRSEIRKGLDSLCLFSNLIHIQ
jgi:hypothetical protein